MGRLRLPTVRPSLVSLESRETPAAAFALTGNAIIPFDTDFPSLAQAAVPVTGLGSGETLQSIDIRPQNGHLYGLTSNGKGGVRLYGISARTGKATPLTAAPVTFTDAGGAAVAIGGTRLEIDFHPGIDRLRIVTDTGVNFRMNPNTGALIDGDTAAGGINPDGKLANGASTANGAGTAFTNSFANADPTTQYTIDATTRQLLIQNPSNTGTLVNGVAITSDGTNKLAFTAVGGFDIPASVAVNANNDPATGSGFAIFTVGGTAALYSVNLANGRASLVGGIGLVATAITGLAVAESRPAGAPLIALDGGNLVRTFVNSTASSKTVAITGLTPGESLVGIDYRPANGQLVALGIDAVAETGTLYLVDPQGGQVAPLVAGTPSAISFTGVNFPAVGYGFDFNPTVDNIRVTTATGLNFRLNPANGLPVDSDGNSANGNTPDTGINGSGVTGVSGTAYTNSFGGAPVTTQYTLDAETDRLFIQNPPNSGSQVLVASVTLGGAKLDFTEISGFDIAPAVQVSQNNTKATGSALAGLTVDGVRSLYRIDLGTGAATLVSPLPNGSRGLTVAEDFSPRRFELYAAGSGPGIANQVVVYNPDGTQRFRFSPYEAGFTGGVYVATGDVNADGIDDIITGTGAGGGPLVRIFDGATGSLTASLFAYEDSFRGGVIVAAGDTNGDGRAEIITGTGVGGGPRVRVLNGNGFGEIANYFAYEDSFRGGVLVGAGDVNGDGLADVLTGTGVGGGPRVRAFSGSSTLELANFFAYEASFRGGVFVAAGNVAGGPADELIAGTGVGGGPIVTVFASNTFESLTAFGAFNVNTRGGVSVGAVDRDGDGDDDIIVGAGRDLSGALRVVNFDNITLLGNTPFGDAFTGGINVG